MCSIHHLLLLSREHGAIPSALVMLGCLSEGYAGAPSYSEPALCLQEARILPFSPRCESQREEGNSLSDPLTSATKEATKLMNSMRSREALQTVGVHTS